METDFTRRKRWGLLPLDGFLRTEVVGGIPQVGLQDS